LYTERSVQGKAARSHAYCGPDVPERRRIGLKMEGDGAAKEKVVVVNVENGQQ
jgi:hypothetical protein